MMRKSIFKFIVFVYLVEGFIYANENLDKSLDNFYIENTNPKINFNKNLLDDLKYQALSSILNIDSKLFDKKEKFSLYVKVSSKSKFGFRYKF